MVSIPSFQVSNYVLEVSAKDNGLPILSSSVMLNIEISDANDNAPLFSQSNYSTVIQVTGKVQVLSHLHLIDNLCFYLWHC